MPPVTNRRSSWRQSTATFCSRLPAALKQLAGAGLGAFIIWQILYLTIANGLETVEVVMHRFPAVSQSYTAALDESRLGSRPTGLGGASSLIFFVDKYGQVTAQPQRWSLFAPGVARQSCFLACELRWEGMEESLWLLSENEPQNPASYFRAGRSRLRSIEQGLAIGFTWQAGEPERDAQQRWGRQIRDKLARQYDILLAWVTLRVEAFLDKHPGAPSPSEVVIHVRGHEIDPPYANSTGTSSPPYCMPLARWKPTASYPGDCLPIEAYDPVAGEFVLQPWPTETTDELPSRIEH